MGRTSMLVSFCRDQLPLGDVREAQSDGEDHVDIRLLGGEGIEDDFHREDGVDIVAVRTEGIGEGIMEGVILIDLGRGVRTGGMIGGDGVRVIVVILVEVRRLSGAGVEVEVAVHHQGEDGIGVLAAVVVAVVEKLWLFRSVDYCMF